VRNGHHPERELVTGIGPIKVRQPRVRHRDDQKFSSAILPLYLRRVPGIVVYLFFKGRSPVLFFTFALRSWPIWRRRTTPNFNYSRDIPQLRLLVDVQVIVLSDVRSYESNARGP
jgi:hypothetical protein